MHPNSKKKNKALLEMINKINTFRHFLLAIILFFTVNTAIAYEPVEKKSAETKSEKFNAGELIIDHITDSHEWHIAGHLALPLPIIIYSSNKGLSIFLSNKLEGGEEYNGYKLNHNQIVAVDEDGMVNQTATAELWDISITKNVMAMFISIALMLWIFLSVAKTYSRNTGKAPKGMQSFVEPLIIFVRDDIAKSAIGEKKYKKYLPFLLTVFFFIWINNLLGLIPTIPGGANVTGNIAIGLTLAAIVFIITIVSANKHYWRHIFAMPGVPIGVLVLLTPIEIFGMFLKPFVLMIRLFANMLAGHIIALSFFSLIFIFAEMNTAVGFGVSIFSVAFTIFMGMLELLVAFLQAYVFTLLAAMYFGSAIEEHHSEETH